MKKLLFALSFLALSTYAQAEWLFAEHKTKVLEVNEKGVVVADSPAFIVGASGIVTHAFDDKSKSIIAQVDVISKDGSKALLGIRKFEMLTQGAFPDTGIKPVVNDEVTINFLYDRALIVTPNQATYNEITKKYNTITWVHPDIVASYLSKIYRPNPDKSIFKQACHQNAASIIFFGIEDKGYFVDCHNFNTLKTISIAKNSEVTLPFYSRIKHIESSWFSWSSSNISDYNNYYSSLLGRK